MNESPLKMVTGVKRKVITSYCLFCQKSSNNKLCRPSDVGKRRFVECLKERKSGSGHSYAEPSEEINLEHLKYKCNNSFVNWQSSCYASYTSKRNIFFCGESSFTSTTDETTELNETAAKRTTQTVTRSKVFSIDFTLVCMFCE